METVYISVADLKNPGGNSVPEKWPWRINKK